MITFSSGGGGGGLLSLTVTAQEESIAHSNVTTIKDLNTEGITLLFILNYFMVNKNKTMP
jgi:hypothetical protein